MRQKRKTMILACAMSLMMAGSAFADVLSVKVLDTATAAAMAAGSVTSAGNTTDGNGTQIIDATNVGNTNNAINGNSNVSSIVNTPAAAAAANQGQTLNASGPMAGGASAPATGGVQASTAFASNVYGNPVNGYYFDAVTTYTYQNLVQDLNTLKAQYGVAVNSLATTADGRSIFHVMVGNPNAKHRILVLGTIHAREYMTSQLVMRQLGKLLRENASGETYKSTSAKAMLQDMCIHFIPMVNPDGATLSQFGLNGIQNPNLRQQVQNIMLKDQQRTNYVGDTEWFYRRWKNNLNGVDVNRQFPLGWEGLNDKVYQPSFQFYKGSAPLVETEAKAIANILYQYKFDEILNFHAQGGVIYWSYSGADAGINFRSKTMADIVAGDTGYKLATKSAAEDGSPTAGYKEFASSMGVPAITVEIGYGDCPVPETQIMTIWAKHQHVLEDLMTELCTQP